MIPRTVCLSSNRELFDVDVEQCNAVECPCGDVRFHLSPSAAEDLSSSTAAAFDIRVDPETWQELEAPQRTEHVSEMVQEFLRDYPPAERLRFAEFARDKKQSARRLREYHLDPAEIERGSLVAFTQLVSEKGSLTEGGRSYAYSFDYGDDHYLVEDMYCANPDCPCDEVHLRYFSYKTTAEPDAAIRIKDIFQASLTWDGKLTIEQCFDFPQGEAEKIAPSWWAEYSDELPILKWRYRKVKEIARRSLRTAAQARQLHFAPTYGRGVLDAVIPHKTSVGRNDACPCGSGKKFKRCCGK